MNYVCFCSWTNQILSTKLVSKWTSQHVTQSAVESLTMLNHEEHFHHTYVILKALPPVSTQTGEYKYHFIQHPPGEFLLIMRGDVLTSHPWTLLHKEFRPSSCTFWPGKWWELAGPCTYIMFALVWKTVMIDKYSKWEMCDVATCIEICQLLTMSSRLSNFPEIEESNQIAPLLFKLNERPLIYKI